MGEESFHIHTYHTVFQFGKIIFFPLACRLEYVGCLCFAILFFAAFESFVSSNRGPWSGGPAVSLHDNLHSYVGEE